jgi:hypothetical protein
MAVDMDGADSEFARHGAGVLPTGTAKARESMVAQVEAALHRYFTDRARHHLIGNIEKTGGNFGAAHVRAPLSGLPRVHFMGKADKRAPGRFDIQGLFFVGAKYLREKVRV